MMVGIVCALVALCYVAVVVSLFHPIAAVVVFFAAVGAITVILYRMGV